MAATSTGLIRCEVIGDAPFANAKLIVIKGLPEYRGGDAPFFVLNEWLRDEKTEPRVVVNIVSRQTGGQQFVVDVPGEPLNFGPRILVPVERVATTV
jgi:hypothetical protein